MFSWIIDIAALLRIISAGVTAAAHESDPVKATAAGMQAASDALAQSGAVLQPPTASSAAPSGPAA